MVWGYCGSNTDLSTYKKAFFGENRTVFPTKLPFLHRKSCSSMLLTYPYWVQLDWTSFFQDGLRKSSGDSEILRFEKHIFSQKRDKFSTTTNRTTATFHCR
jgi:hypothetical protein